MPTTVPPPPATTDPPPVTTPIETTTTAPVITDPPVTTAPPVTTQNPPTTPPPTRTTLDPVTTAPPRTTTRDPPKTSDPSETTPYTTHYVTTVSVITITTVVPHTTMISGTVTTVYETLTTTMQTPTVVPDPNQAPPPLGLPQTWPNRGRLQAWQIATIAIAVLALFSACASVILLAWMRKKRHEDKNRGVLEGLEPWDEKKGASADGSQHHQQHVHGGAGSSGDPQGYSGVWPAEAGVASFGHTQDGSGSTYNSGYPEPRGYSSDMYAYDLSGGGGVGSGMSEVDYHGVYGGLLMSPQQQAQLPPHGYGGGYYESGNYLNERPEGNYYSSTQPRVQYPTPPSHNTSSPTSATGLRQGQSRAMESVDYVDGYGHGQEQQLGVPRQGTLDYLADADPRRESHDGTQESATLGRLDSRRTEPGGVNLLWDDPSKDRGQKDLGGEGGQTCPREGGGGAWARRRGRLELESGAKPEITSGSPRRSLGG